MPMVFGTPRRNLGPFAVGLLGALLVSSVAAAGDAAATAAQTKARKAAPAPVQTTVAASPARPHWTFSAEAIGLARSGGASQVLVGRLPGSMQFATTETASASAVQAFNSNQFRQGFAAGPKLSAQYHDDSGFGVELSYFNVFNLTGSKTVGPTGPASSADWLVMYAPGTFWQTQDFPYQGMAWKDVTSLYSAEANGRWDFSPRVTLLAGLRWLQLNDWLQGTLPPPDRNAPTWKTPCLEPNPPACALSDATSTDKADVYPPFWTTSTTNNLYGAQIGVDAKLLELGRISLDGQLKAGLLDNDARQTTVVSMEKHLFSAHAATNVPAFVGEASLELKYQLTGELALKAGYEALRLDGVALAPGQIGEASTTHTSVTARGVNCGSNVLFQGVTLGLAYSF